MSPTERGALDPLSQLLGSIVTKLDTVIATQGEDRKASAEYRTNVRSELKEMRIEVRSNTTDIAEVSKELAQLKPKVDKLQETYLMNVGARRFAGLLGKAAHALSAGLGAAIVFLLERWFK